MKSPTKLFYPILSVLMLLLFANGCEEKKESESQSATEIKSESEPKASSKPSEKKAGKYCFELKDEAISIRGELKLSENKNVEGILNGNRLDQETSSKTAFEIRFVGDLQGDLLILKTTGDEFGSTLKKQETWKWSGELLIENGRSLREVSCG